MQRKSSLAVHLLHSLSAISTQQTEFEVAEYSASVGGPTGQLIRSHELPLQKTKACSASLSGLRAILTEFSLHGCPHCQLATQLHYAACTGKYMLLSTLDPFAPAA